MAVGEIQSVTIDEDLTYDFDADGDDYFYKVEGTEGEMIVVANFSYDNETWFQSIKQLDGTDVDSPKNLLAIRPVPFNGRLAMKAWQIFDEDPNASEQLSLGEIKLVYESSDQSGLSEANNRRLTVVGQTGEQDVLIECESSNFETIRRIEIVDDDESTLIWESERQEGI